MKVLRRWHPRTFHLGDQTIDLTLKALTKAEALEFLQQLARLGRKARDTDPTDEDAVVAGLRELSGEFVTHAFTHYVRVAEELQTEEGERIETGQRLVQELPNALTFEILLAIQALCVQNETQGKGSGSPSTSSAEGGAPVSGGSPATSTTAAGGTEPSTVPQTLPANGSSSASVLGATP